MTVYGYVSDELEHRTSQQQIAKLSSAGTEKLIGVDQLPPEQKTDSELRLLFVLNTLSAGDSLVITELGSLCKSAQQTMTLFQLISERNIQLKILELNFDSFSDAGKQALTLMSAVFELDRSQTHKRQAEGIAKAKKKGKYKGRNSEYQKHIPMVRNLVEMGKGPTYIAQQLNISRTTVYKIKHEIHLDGQTAMDI